MTEIPYVPKKLRDSVYSKTARNFLDLIIQRDIILEKGGIIPNTFSPCLCIRGFIIHSDPDTYEIEREIGFGKYSRVFRGYDKNGQQVVLKVLKPTPIRRVIREVCILSALSEGPNIIKFIEVITDPLSESISLAFEYVKNEANKTLYPKLTPTDVQYYMFQILRALEYSMSKNIMHRDVKPSNIMIDHSRRQLRLVDWGLSEYYVPGTTYSVRVSSLNFKGPELLLGYTLYDPSLDMWCLGCVFAEMLFCKYPFFHGADLVTQVREIVSVLGTNGILEYIERYDLGGENLDHSMHSAIMGYTAKSWRSFVSPQNACKCSDEALDLLSKLLKYDHKERITPTKALSHSYFDSVRDIP